MCGIESERFQSNVTLSRAAAASHLVKNVRRHYAKNRVTMVDVTGLRVHDDLPLVDLAVMRKWGHVGFDYSLTDHCSGCSRITS
jgi:hypothetical protein